MEGKWANPYSIQLTNNTEKRKRSGPSPTVSHTHTHIKRHKSLTKKTKTTQKFWLDQKLDNTKVTTKKNTKVDQKRNYTKKKSVKEGSQSEPLHVSQKQKKNKKSEPMHECISNWCCTFDKKKNDAARCSRGEEREGRAARWGGHGRTLTAPTSRVRSGCNSRISRRQRGVATERGRTAGHRGGGDLAPSFFFFFFSVLWFYLSQCLLLLLRLLLLIFLQIISYGVMNFCYCFFFPFSSF